MSAVFLSYRHEDEAHCRRVLELGLRLESAGVTVILDQLEQERRFKGGGPDESWAHWSTAQAADESHKLLIVASPGWFECYELKAPGQALGATAEAGIIRQRLYQSGGVNPSIRIVSFEPIDEHAVPLDLRGYHRFVHPRDFEQLSRWLGAIDPCPGAPARDPLPPGLLRGPGDPRLQPRHARLYGRELDVARVLAFLRDGECAAVCAQVTGTGGIGKTEVCKAALKAWLAETPGAAAYYVDVPDGAGADVLMYRVGRAMGAENVATFDELRPLLREGLYYLDNLESIADALEGHEALRGLGAVPGVRILASSRVSLPTVLGRPIELEALPVEAAEALFRDLWSGGDGLPPDGGPRRFVDEDLGRHALSVTLMARMGDTYSFGDLVARWREAGAAAAQDGIDLSRQGNLRVSLRLTSDSLAASPGVLDVWTLAALFPGGIDLSLLRTFEQQAGCPETARLLLTRHHVWVRRGERFHLLPPVARYALDEATHERGGFGWRRVRGWALAWLEELAKSADVLASSDEALTARGLLLGHFSALHRAMLQDAAHAEPDRASLQRLDRRLRNQYQFRATLSAEILRALIRVLDRPAHACRSLGDLEKRLGRPDEAHGLYDRAFKLFARERNGLGQASTLKSLADLDVQFARLDEAFARYQGALKLFGRERDDLGRASTLKSLADLAMRLTRPHEARRRYDRALRLYTKQRAGLGQADTLKSLGDLEARRDLTEARRLYREALQLYEREQSGVGQANTLKSLGDLEMRSDLDAARKHYDRALELFTSEQFGLGQASTLKSLGDLEMRLDRPEPARGLYDRALAHFERERFKLGIASTLKSLGDLEMRSDLAIARDRYERALGIFEDERAGLGQADTLKSLGDLEARMDRPEMARDRYHRARSIYRRENAGLAEADTLMSLGDVEASVDRPGGGAALETYEAARAILQRFVAADPGNTALQRDLATSHRKIGLVQRPRAQG